MHGQKGGFAWKGWIIMLLVFGVTIAGFAALVTRVNTASGREQTDALNAALRSAVITCYATEGRYPDSIEYLKENYGVVIDEDMYAVSYDAFASNVMPVIRVQRKEAQP